MQWKIKTLDHLKQTDETSCGAFVCYFFKLTVMDQINVEKGMFFPNDLRKNIFDELQNEFRNLIQYEKNIFCFICKSEIEESFNFSYLCQYHSSHVYCKENLTQNSKLSLCPICSIIKN